MASASTHARKAENSAEQVTREVKQVTKHPWTQDLIRFGYVARGILFAAIGLIALQVGLGHGGQPKDQPGALAFIAQQPFGKALLVLVLIGLIGYSLWGFIRAVFDPLNRGDKPTGILSRIGFAVSGVSYGLLVYPAFQLLQGASSQPQSSTQKTQDITAQLLQQPWGPWAIALVGLITVGWALSQIRIAYTGKFEYDFKSNVMTSLERQWAEPIGKVGIGARALVFILIGAFLIQAALQHNPQKAQGLDGALLALAQWPGGPWLLLLAALGLLVFGIYSILAARWMDVT